MNLDVPKYDLLPLRVLPASRNFFFSVWAATISSMFYRTFAATVCGHVMSVGREFLSRGEVSEAKTMNSGTRQTSLGHTWFTYF